MPSAGIAQLERYEAFKRDVLAELAETEVTLRTLKAQGKTRSATYQQLLANRYALQGIVDRLVDHGIQMDSRR